MAQYVTYNEGRYNYWTDPDTGLLYRVGQRSYNFVEDAEIVVGGFALAENVGWVNLVPRSGSIPGKSREGVRSTEYVVDMGENFGGTENVDWENLTL